MNNHSIRHRERIEKCLSGETTDRVPVALWRHFPVDDQSPELLANATIAFQNQFDFDIIKVSPSSSFCLKDWGSDDIWNGAAEGTRNYIKRVVQKPDDWQRLKVLNPNKGHLGDQLACLRLIHKAFSPDTPIVQTIFSPMAQAKNLVGGEKLITHMRLFPEALHAGLQKITQSTIVFIEEMTKTGIDGIFYAIQHAQYQLLTIEEFNSFCKPYDLQILRAVENLWLNMIHIHGENIMFNEVGKYPVQIINWHDQHTPPSLAEGQNIFKGVVCGGLKRLETMVLSNSDQVVHEARHAMRMTDKKRFILGTGCVLPVTAPFGNIMAARQSVEIN